MYQFQTVFRNQAVIIDYDVVYGIIESAIVTNHNPNFLHPDYECFDKELDIFHNEVHNLALNHFKKVLAVIEDNKPPEIAPLPEKVRKSYTRKIKTVPKEPLKNVEFRELLPSFKETKPYEFEKRFYNQ